MTTHNLRSPFERAASAATAVICCLSLACSLPGCGGGDEVAATGRANASGKVEFDGKPLPAGTVTFMHQDKGNTSVCTVSDGEFECEDGQGPTPGPNTVMVMGTNDDGQPMWAAPWRTNVTVEETDYTGEFKIEAGAVKPYDPSKALIDN